MASTIEKPKVVIERDEGYPHGDRFAIYHPAEEFSVSSCTLCTKKWEGSKSGFIWSVRTAESYQRQGLARTLLQKVIASAKRRKMSHIDLYVYAENESAKKLYASLGFVDITGLDDESRRTYRLTLGARES